MQGGGHPAVQVGHGPTPRQVGQSLDQEVAPAQELNSVVGHQVSLAHPRHGRYAAVLTPVTAN